MSDKEQAQQSSANGVAWDLSDLYASVEDPVIEKDLANSLERAQQFEKTYRGNINVSGGPSAEFLLEAVSEMESLTESLDKPLIFAHLLHSAKTDNPAHGKLLSRTQEQRTVINKHLIFFDLEWVQVADDDAKRLCESETVAKYRHYLEQLRAWKPHYLSEAEEKLLDEKNITGRSAFVRLFDETVSAINAPFEHGGKTETLTLQQLLAKLYEPDRSVRQSAARAITAGLKNNTKLLTYIFNTIVVDHRSDCGLRNFDDPMGPRHLANEIQAEVVDALMIASERHHETVQRYYRLKGKLLKLDTLYDYDRYAPLFDDLPACDWKRARTIVQQSYSAFSPKAGEIIERFFEKNWIDAELRDGKRGGAFSSGTVPSVHPYILMNYTDQMRDVMTLAHELGHGLHQYLSRDVGYLQCNTPLTTAEMASVFGEMLTFQQLLRENDDPRVRLALLCSKIEDAFATVFRQIVLTRFEQTLHKARLEEGELEAKRIGELWMDANRPMHGDVVEMTEDYTCWWLYIGHFIHVPFYCYAYSFGELLVLALVQKYKEEGDAFVPNYLDLLASGGSDAPHALLAKLGVDVNDPKFWELGLQLLGDMVAEAEELAGKL